MANFTFANDDKDRPVQGGGKVTANGTNFTFAPNEFARNMQEQGWTGPSMDDMSGEDSAHLRAPLGLSFPTIAENGYGITPSRTCS